MRNLELSKMSSIRCQWCLYSHQTSKCLFLTFTVTCKCMLVFYFNWNANFYRTLLVSQLKLTILSILLFILVCLRFEHVFYNYYNHILWLFTFSNANTSLNCENKQKKSVPLYPKFVEQKLIFINFRITSVNFHQIEFCFLLKWS